jgi:hypothetical protein
MRWLSVLVALAGAFALATPAPVAAQARAPLASLLAEQGASAFSAQARRPARRSRTRPRITVRPALPTGERDLTRWRRDCVPVFEERWIPQWGGHVLYASQRCRWVRL